MQADDIRPGAKGAVRILLIDTDSISNAVLKKILAEGSETVVMPDVVAALDWDSHYPPQLIMLGTGTIAIEGAGAVARFKKRFPDVKILIVCDALDEAGVSQAQLLGAESTLLRPLRRETVRSKVNRMLGQSLKPNRMLALNNA